MTVASARTTRGRGGSPRSKSMRRRWTPEPSVRALIVSTRSGSARPGPGSHQGTNVPKTKSSRFGGRKKPGVALTRQLTSAPGSAPPA